MTSGGASGPQFFFLDSLPLAIFLDPLINYAVIRPLSMILDFYDVGVLYDAKSQLVISED